MIENGRFGHEQKSKWNDCKLFWVSGRSHQQNGKLLTDPLSETSVHSGHLGLSKQPMSLTRCSGLSRTCCQRHNRLSARAALALQLRQVSPRLRGFELDSLRSMGATVNLSVALMAWQF
jgi:hypothetical protein